MHALYIVNVIDVVSDKGTPLIAALISHGPCTLSLMITLTNTVLDLAGYICPFSNAASAAIKPGSICPEGLMPVKGAPSEAR